MHHYYTLAIIFVLNILRLLNGVSMIILTNDHIILIKLISIIGITLLVKQVLENIRRNIHNICYWIVECLFVLFIICWFGFIIEQYELFIDESEYNLFIEQLYC